ncbi:hypothetical protein QBC47DRAFT_399832 [Echria macrotheca]|uniref:Uncharacterized protein n=1 Tax=Echria macrotheca TaxID=438768 RepID=A0AAJ0BFT1_9PEZI|nr:hypothetical protein QBC47DRAFT_399832 [Echria macrotheca]
MPATDAPQQQAPMEAVSLDNIVTQQPGAEPQPEMTMRGGFMEECNCCCFGEECACC